MPRKPNRKPKKKYAKPLSLYPLTPEEAIRALLKVDPKKVEGEEKKVKEKGRKTKRKND